MDKILCVGSACKDIFFPTAEGKIIETPEDLMSQKKIAFELGTKYKIENACEALGGCAANVASGLAKLGINSGCASGVGDDAIGTWILSEIQKNAVNGDMMVIQKNRKSDLSAIIVDTNSADRIIFSNKNSSGDLNLDAEKIRDIKWIFIGDIHGRWEDQLEMIMQLAKSEGKRIAFNPREVNIHEDTVEIIQAISLCEVVFVNKDEAIEIVSHMKVKEKITDENLNSEKFLLEKLISLEPKVAVITDGRRGAWASDGKNIIYSPALEVKAVDSTGAGDAFSTGFLAAQMKGKEISECLKWGIANSSSEVQFYGSIEGLLDEEKIIKKAEEVKTESV